MKALVAGATLALLVACADDAAGKPPAELAHLPRSELRAVTASGTHRFKVWIAADPASRERGLMFVRELPADHGMLFVFEQPQFTTFWMKDTYLSLDLVFIASDGRVVGVAANAEPLSLAPIESAAPVKALLEVPGGTAARIGLAAGDRVTYEFRPPATSPDSDGRR